MALVPVLHCIAYLLKLSDQSKVCLQIGLVGYLHSKIVIFRIQMAFVNVYLFVPNIIGKDLCVLCRGAVDDKMETCAV